MPRIFTYIAWTIGLLIHLNSAVALAGSDTEQFSSLETPIRMPGSGSEPPDRRLQPIIIGLDAPLSGTRSQAGEAIRRGLVLAIREINEKGGVLGRPFKLVARDNQGIPARGLDNINKFTKLDNLVAVVGGLRTPVAVAQHNVIHKHKLIYLGPWAAGTQVVDNGYHPNFVFRVSARDQDVGSFLIRAAIRRGFRRPGLLLKRSTWGRSNEKAMTEAMRQVGIRPAAVRWFSLSQPDISNEIDELIKAGSDVIMLVAGSREGLTIVRNMASRTHDKRVPIISHWGIPSGENFAKDPAVLQTIDFTFLQTYSFYAPKDRIKSDRLLKAYCRLFGDCGGPSAVFGPVGTAHAYDLVFLLRNAIQSAGTIKREKVRDSLEQLNAFRGLVRDYSPAFSPDRHDALNISDYQLCRYDAHGNIIPIKEYESHISK